MVALVHDSLAVDRPSSAASPWPQREGLRLCVWRFEGFGISLDSRSADCRMDKQVVTPGPCARNQGAHSCVSWWASAYVTRHVNWPRLRFANFIRVLASSGLMFSPERSNSAATVHDAGNWPGPIAPTWSPGGLPVVRPARRLLGVAAPTTHRSPPPGSRPAVSAPGWIPRRGRSARRPAVRRGS
jgi:hypothetical protein